MKREERHTSFHKEPTSLLRENRKHWLSESRTTDRSPVPSQGGEKKHFKNVEHSFKAMMKESDGERCGPVKKKEKKKRKNHSSVIRSHKGKAFHLHFLPRVLSHGMSSLDVHTPQYWDQDNRRQTISQGRETTYEMKISVSDKNNRTERGWGVGKRE